jgi:hypothetical protein
VTVAETSDTHRTLDMCDGISLEFYRLDRLDMNSRTSVSY